MDRAALINYLTHSIQTLHAEDQRLEVVLRRVQKAGAFTPGDFEAVIDAQRTSLRIPANSLLMLIGAMEADRDDQTGHESHESRAGQGARADRADLEREPARAAPLPGGHRPLPLPVTQGGRIRRALVAFLTALDDDPR